MIQYSLKCVDGHQFESWFQSAHAFDKLNAAGHVSCAICGKGDVTKALMAPRVTSGTAETPRASLSGDKSLAEKAMSALKNHVEKNSDYVGHRFADDARAMYLGEIEARPIWGEARPDQARSLAEDGIPVAPLPFTPSRKSN